MMNEIILCDRYLDSTTAYQGYGNEFDVDIINELISFIAKRNSFEADDGHTDDLVMSLATACYVRDTALKFAQQGIDITRAAVRNWQKSAPGIYTGGVSKKEAGWTQDLGDKGQEDLTWLL